MQQEMEQVAGGRRSGGTTDVGSYLGGGKLFCIRRKRNLVDEGQIQYSVLEGAAEIGMLSGIVGRSPAGEDVYRGEDAES